MSELALLHCSANVLLWYGMVEGADIFDAVAVPDRGCIARWSGSFCGGFGLGCCCFDLFVIDPVMVIDPIKNHSPLFENFR